MMSRCFYICLMLVLGLLSHPASAATLNVPTQYATIQAAVNAAANGDTVFISDGTYTGPGNVDIDFGGKNLTVTSQNGAANAIIDCGGSSANHRGFYLHSGETSANINGLTIKNGYEYNDYGGGIFIGSSGKISVTNCTITNSKATYGGGGIYSSLNSGVVSVTNCVLDSNTASYNGGGIYNLNDNSGTGTINVIGCTISNNRAGRNGSGSGGGGIYNLNNGSGTINISNCALGNNLSGTSGNRGDGGAISNINYSSNPISVNGCTITNNSAIYGGSGGGINNNNNGAGTISVTLCTVSGNAASDGGGICNASDSNASGTINVTSCAISGNTASDGNGGGGGVYNSSSNAGTTLMACCTITNNTANYGSGGGVCNFNNSTGTMSVINCVVAGNTLTNGEGGGIVNYNGYNYATGTISVTNCTIINNTAQSNDGGGGGIFNSNANGNMSLITVANTILYGNTGGDYGYSGSNILINYCDILGGFAGIGNINADPLFVVPANMGGFPDLHLQYGSPCLGAGTASGAPATTIDGKTRPNPPSIGAYEAAQTGTATALASSLNPSTAGQSVTFTATVTGASGTPTGAVTFTLDGTAQAPVTLASGQAAFATSALTAGSHTLTAAYNGDQFNAASMSAALTQTVSPLSSSLVNDTSSGISYTGSGWFHSAGRGAGDYQDDVHATAVNGAAFSYTFTGTGISYVTETNTDEGNVQVYLDGTLQATVSAYSATRKVQQVLWSKSGLAAGSHTLKIVKASGQYMLIDALQVSPAIVTTLNDTSSDISYAGSGWFYSANRGIGDFQNDVHATRSNGDSVSYTFAGTGISYITETNSDEGGVAAYVDGVLKQTVNCSTATRSVQQTVYSVSGLASGPHTLKLVKTSGTYMLLDALSFQ